MERILIIYSNPAGTDRLRLDKEHKAIDQALISSRISQDVVIRKHASSFEDIAKALSEQEYSVFQFSGHGSAKGICLEQENHNKSDFISADRISQLIHETQPKIKLAIFMSCFSADAIPHLIRSAPYLLTVFGEANDEAAIEFMRIFFETYFKTNSITRASLIAQSIAEDRLHAVLTRRALDNNEGKALIQVCPSGNHVGDTYLVDISNAEQDIANLEISRESFLSVLIRKIRLHNRIFDFPRERSILPIGQFIGLFSWENASDVIKCNRIMKFKPEIETEVCEIWAHIAVIYNDHVIERYRSLPQNLFPSSLNYLKLALSRYRNTYDFLSNHKGVPQVLSKYLPEQYKLTKSMMQANLSMAENKIFDEDFQSSIVYLENALSTLHDLLDALTEKVSVGL